MITKKMILIYGIFKPVIIVACLFLATRCSTLQHESENNLELAQRNYGLSQASQSMSRMLAIPGGKVCLGNIDIEFAYQEPLINSFLQDLEIALSNKMKVLERKRLREIVLQHQTETSQFFAKDNLQNLGKFTQVQYIVLGELREHTVHYEILMKLIDVNTAIIQRTGKVSIGKEKIPSSIIQEMSRLELVQKGYSSDQDILQYFTRSHTIHQTTQNNLEKPLEVQIQGNKKNDSGISPLQRGDILHQYDQYQFQVRFNKPAYLYSIGITQQGKVISIYPDSHLKMAQITRQEYILPGPDTQNWFTVQDSQGIGQIGMLISMTPIPALEQLMEKMPADSEKLNIATTHKNLFEIPEEISRKSKNSMQVIQEQKMFEFYQDNILIPLF